MSRVVAIFDVDQTLVQGYTERLFFRYLVRQGLLSVPRALAYLGQVARRPQTGSRTKVTSRGCRWRRWSAWPGGATGKTSRPG